MPPRRDEYGRQRRTRLATYESYDDILRLHLIPGLGHIALAKFAPAEVQGLLNEKLESGLSPRRVEHIHAVRRRALGVAERWGTVSRNVAKLVDPPRVPKHEIKPLTPEEARRLIDAAVDDRYRALWITALRTGLRQGELLRLRWDDASLETAMLRVRHTGFRTADPMTSVMPPRRSCSPRASRARM